MTAPLSPPAWTVEVASLPGENVDDDRLVAIADRLDELVAASAATLAGPVISAHIPTGTLRLTITVEVAASPEDAARQAAAASRQATGAAGIGTLHVAQAEALDPLPVGA